MDQSECAKSPQLVENREDTSDKGKETEIRRTMTTGDHEAGRIANSYGRLHQVHETYYYIDTTITTTK
jgi:hypothetical protein